MAEQDFEELDGFCMDDLVSVRCGKIDEMHRDLLMGFIECRRTLGRGSATELAAVCHRLRALLDDLEQHCAREEWLLRAAGYAQLEQHREAHEALCTYLRQAAMRLERGGTPEEAEIILEQAFTRLLTHFNTTDILYAGVISDQSSPPGPWTTGDP